MPPLRLPPPERGAAIEPPLPIGQRLRDWPPVWIQMLVDKVGSWTTAEVNALVEAFHLEIEAIGWTPDEERFLPEARDKKVEKFTLEFATQAVEKKSEGQALPPKDLANRFVTSVQRAVWDARARKGETTRAGNPDLAEGSAADFEDPVSRLDAQALAAWFFEWGRSNLPDQVYQALVRVLLEGDTWEEVARDLDVPGATTRSWGHRYIPKVRAAWEQHLDAEAQRKRLAWLTRHPELVPAK